MKVYFVGAGPGAPDLLTVKAERLLKDCRFLIYAGSLVSPEVLELVPPQAERHDSAGLSLGKIIDLCREARQRGVDVVRLHSGDPSIYGATREQMNALDGHGIDYEVVPGVSSFQAAAAALRVELTAPEVSQTIILARTSGRTPLPPEQELEELARTRATLCLFLSKARLEEITERLIKFYGRDCPAAVVYHASWPDQKIVRGTLAGIAAATERAGVGQTSLILIGPALGRDIPASKLYDRRFTHQYRKGSAS